MHKAHVPLRLAVYQWLGHLQLDDVSSKARKQGERKKKDFQEQTADTDRHRLLCPHASQRSVCNAVDGCFEVS